jgi:hypothetical protein
LPSGRWSSTWVASSARASRSHLDLDRHDAGRPDRLKDPPLAVGLRPGDDLRDPELAEDGDRQHLGGEVLADRDDGRVHVHRPDRSERVRLDAIHLGRHRDLVPHRFHRGHVGVEGNDLRPRLGQRLGHGPPEPSQPDHEHPLHGSHPIIMRSAGNVTRARSARRASAKPSVSGPVRPMNMITMITTLPQASSPGVTPADIPTVPNAETASKASASGSPG